MCVYKLYLLTYLLTSSRLVYQSLWFICASDVECLASFVPKTRKPPVEAALVVTYLQFPIQVCFPGLIVCPPRPTSHAHFRHVTDTFRNSLVVLTIVWVPKIQNRAHDPDHAHLDWFVTCMLGLTLRNKRLEICVYI